MANGLYVGDRLYGYGTSGSSSTYVYVVDSGVLRTHQEFDYWQVNPGRQFSTDGFSETSPCGGEVSLGDYRFGSHGTAVASVIAGKVVGVAPGVSLVPVKIGNCDGTSYLSWWCWAMDWVASPAYYDPATGQPDLERGNPYPKSGAVLNLSVYYDLDAPFDAQTPLGAFEHTVQNVIAAGITVVASANNGYKDSCQTSPARLAHGNYDATSGDAWRSAPHRVISVGGTDEYDRRWRCGDFGDCFASNYGSNNGRCVDLYAPAHNVKVAYFGREIYDGVNYFYPYRPAGGPSSGTSFAAPLVAGVAARLLQSSFMSPSSLWQAILARTLPLPRNFDDDGVDANDRLVFISPGE